MNILKEVFFLVEEAPEGVFTARALEVSIFSEADTMEELREKIRNAARCYFVEHDLSRMIRLHFVKDEILTV